MNHFISGILKIVLLEGFFEPSELVEVLALRLATVVHCEEQVRLLDASGREVARLEASRRHANHSPDWGR